MREVVLYISIIIVSVVCGLIVKKVIKLNRRGSSLIMMLVPFSVSAILISALGGD